MFKNNTEKQKKFIKFLGNSDLIIFLMNILITLIGTFFNFDAEYIRKLLIIGFSINFILTITFYISIFVYKESFKELIKDNTKPHKYINKNNIEKQKKLIKLLLNINSIMLLINLVIIPIILTIYDLNESLDLTDVTVTIIYIISGGINIIILIAGCISIFVHQDAYNEIEKDNYIIPHNYTNKNETLNLFKELILKKKYKYKYEENIENNQLTFFDNNHINPQDIIILVDLQNTDENALKMLYEHILYFKVKIRTTRLVVNIIFLSNKYNKELVRKIDKELFSGVINILFISFDENYKYIETQSHSFTTFYFFHKIFKLLGINKKDRVKTEIDLYNI